jgi:2-polyprenyl-6-methoxyphenol hydroxylase-like FAD-dependent oxidoreductase
MTWLGKHAVVIGGSIAGLVTARALADHFELVTILERDRVEDVPAVHKSVPQGHHIHTLLLGGTRALSSFYPSFTEQLEGSGSIAKGQHDSVNYHSSGGKSYSLTGTVKEPRDFGWTFFTQSRGLLEQCIRQLTLRIPNVQFESDCTVHGLIHDEGRVRGIRFERHNEQSSLEADLVADAGGRGSHAPRWLAELGYQRPSETVIGVDFAYSTTKFHLPGYEGEPERRLFFYGQAPYLPKAAILWEIEGGAWQVSIGGRFGDYPPGDHDGFLAFASSLWTPRLYDILKSGERVAEISQHRFPTSIWRHYESLSAYPERLIVLGDAISSFNPIYGQGMSSAALQAWELHKILDGRAIESRGLDGLPAEFFAKAAEVVTTPWALAAGFDFAFPRTKGERPPDFIESGRYFQALDAMTANDAEIHRLVMEVMFLARPLSALTEEPLRSRVLGRMNS